MRTTADDTRPDTEPARRRRRAARVAYAVLFVSFLDVFALLPTIAPHAVAMGAGPAMVGLLVGAYSATNLPANLVGGALVDRIGRRPVLLGGLLAAAAAVAAYALAATPAQLVALRMVHGVAGGVLVPAVFAVASDHAGPRSGGAGRTMGRAGAVIGAAAVVAPATAGVVRQFLGVPAVFLGVAALLVLGALLTALGVREPAHPEGAAAPGPATPVPAGEGPRGRRRVDLRPWTGWSGEVRRTLAALAVTTAGVGVLAGFLPGLVEGAGGAPSLTGALFTVYAVVAAALMLSPLAGRVDREGPRRPVALGLVALGIALGLLALGGGIPVAVVAVVTFGVGYGLVFPAASGAVALAAPAGRRGRAFGWFNVAFSLGLAVGPPAAGWASERVPTLDPFATAGLCCLVAAGLVASRRGRPRGRDRGGDREGDGNVRRSTPEARPPGSRRRASRGR